MTHVISHIQISGNFFPAGHTSDECDDQKRHDGDQADKHRNTFHRMKFAMPVATLPPPVHDQNMDEVNPETRSGKIFFDIQQRLLVESGFNEHEPADG